MINKSLFGLSLWNNIFSLVVIIKAFIVFLTLNALAPSKTYGIETNFSNTTDQPSTDILIRDILLHQSTAYYDELILEQLAAAANMSSPTPESWEAIVSLLNKSMINSNDSHNKASSASFKASNLVKNGSLSKSSSKKISLLTLKHDEDYTNEQQQKNQEQNVTITKSIYSRIESAIDEFPSDFMSDDVRKKGGFLVHIIIFIYLSVVLAVICDNYFLKSLEYISEALHLPSDIAGATFMAIGTSAPELFTSVIGVFISDNDIGTGTIVGSAVFNLIAIPGACGFAAYYNLKLMPKINPFPIIRDTIFYVLTIITLILCIKDNKVDWIESLTLISLYIVYIIIMYFNAQISHVVGNKQQFRRHHSDQYLHVDASDDIEKHQKHKVMELGIEESQPLLLTDESVKRLSPPPAYQSNGTTFIDVPRQQQQSATTESNNQLDLSKIHLAITEDGKFKEIISSNSLNRQLKANRNTSERKNSGSNGNGEIELKDFEQSIDVDSLNADWSDNPFIQFVLFPFHIIFFLTLPKPTRFCFVITFVCSIIWIACLTYFIVWMVTLVGYTLGIPDTVSGITVLAAGTSIPELISSYLIVKKAGLADMAICNSIGSNIFDILFCLGLPWLFKSSIVIMTNGFGLATLANSYIPIQSTALPITSLTLLLTIGAMILIFKASKWRLNLQLGILCLIVYIVFVMTSTSLELNI